jgi:penicillin amidase
MKRLGFVVFVLGLGLAVAGCWGAIHGYKQKPALAVYDGTLKVAGLRGPVAVNRDEYGVPHIFTEDEHDLFFAAGYVQAQDRLWEMILLRAAAEGRMSELFGELGAPGVEMMGYPLSTFGIDRRQRTMGMKFMGELGEALLRETSPAVFGQLQAFCDGVNAFIAGHADGDKLPLEFRVLRTRPEPWRVADIVSFGRFIGSMLCSNLEVELSRHAAIKALGPEAGWELAPLFGQQGPTIVPPELLKNRLAVPRDLPPGGRPSDRELGFSPTLSARAALDLLQAENAVKLALHLDAGMGSNNWIIAPKLSATGRALLANDPHLQHLEPSLFYLMHLKGAGIDAFGAAFPGIPYIVLGHTRKLAWGATTSRADVQDLFVETVDPKHPGRYRYRGEWRPFVEREETIRVKTALGMVERTIKIRQTVHGPIVNELTGKLEDDPPMAYRWTGWDLSRDPRAFELAVSSRTVEEFMAAYRALPDKFTPLNVCLFYNILMRGDSIADFIAGMETVDLPNQNWIAADADGHIAYLPGGLAPIRGRGLGVLPAPGESGAFDWTGFIPTRELPQLIDPERGFVATANNEVVDAEWYPYIFSTSYGEPWRAMRIEELIKKLQPLDLDDMKRIQNDIYVKRAEWEVPFILRAVENKKPTDPRVLRAVAELQAWDYEADLDSTATVIFFTFTRQLMTNILEDDVDPKLLSALKLEGYPDMAINLMLERGQSRFFDDQRTRDRAEDRDDIIVAALTDAMAEVEKKYGTDPANRQWGKIHWIKWYHPLSFFGEYRRLAVGPFPHLGADQTVRIAKGAGFGRAPFKTLMGPCLRHLIDLGDPDHALMVIDGSESGQYLSPHYQDLHRLYLESRYLTADMDPERVQATARYRLRLEP